MKNVDLHVLIDYSKHFDYLKVMNQRIEISYKGKVYKKTGSNLNKLSWIFQEIKEQNNLNF